MSSITRFGGLVFLTAALNTACVEDADPDDVGIHLETDYDGDGRTDFHADTVLSFLPPVAVDGLINEPMAALLVDAFREIAVFVVTESGKAGFAYTNLLDPELELVIKVPLQVNREREGDAYEAITVRVSRDPTEQDMCLIAWRDDPTVDNPDLDPWTQEWVEHYVVDWSDQHDDPGIVRVHYGDASFFAFGISRSGDEIVENKLACSPFLGS